MASAEFTPPESTQAVPTVETPSDEEQVNVERVSKTALKFDHAIANFQVVNHSRMWE